MKTQLFTFGLLFLVTLGFGQDKVLTFDIDEPDAPISVDAVITDVIANGFTNGNIRATVRGGTPFGNGSYTYQWRNSANQVLTSTTTVVTGLGYEINLNAIGAGAYTLTVTDANHAQATTQGGCVFSETYTVTEPPALTVTIVEENSISCNPNNTYSDPSNDGILRADASGGVPFDPPINGFYNYIYTWKKKDDAGVWQELVGETTDRLTNLEEGEYAVNIKDAEGIILGTYINNTLDEPADKTYIFNAPNLLEVNLAKTDVFCNNGNDGTITTTITGGTGNYTVFWNTGATTPNLTNLSAGTYTISVTDEKGCQAEASITLTEPPSPLEVQYTFVPPTFASATNGRIIATVTGGTAFSDGSYNFLWQNTSGTDLVAQVTAIITTNSYELTLNTIGKDTYFLTIEDANFSSSTDSVNCTIFRSAFDLDAPEPLEATITVGTPISCNSSNTYGDPFSDGVLICNAEGGVPLLPSVNNGLSYYYTWKKEVSPGVWEVLPSQVSNIATDLDDGHYAVNIEDANGIIIGVYDVNNQLETPTDVTFQFDEPPLLEVSLAKRDVFCHLGNDGWVEATITGGIPPYTTTWSNGETTLLIEDITAGTYTVTITDSRGCQVDDTIDIVQPQAPLIIDYAFARPSTVGGSDAWVEAQITGGTALADGSYSYTWTDEGGTSLNSQTSTSFVGTNSDIFQIRLDAIPSGTYVLTIEDANYEDAIAKEGCTIIEDTLAIYDPIEASVELFIPISCNQTNVFDNPFSDGQLIATITGGEPFETGQPYTYYWKKQDSFGNYIDLPEQTSEIAVNLSAGNYALNVEDAAGNVIGVYDSATLVEATDILFTLEEPELLELTLNSTAIDCDTGNNGAASVSITGGIPPYSIQWSTGATSATINSLIAGTYLVYVIDARGCEATGQIQVNQPGGLEINVVEQRNPYCYLGNTGQITVSISGGQAPYTYQWDTGATTSSISNLSEGAYNLQIIDANGCTAFRDFVLVNPEPITVDLGGDRTLCNNQALDLDIGIDDSNASYNWVSDNGFSSTASSVSLTEAGMYTVTLTTSLGCVGTDTITITTSDADIDAQFLITTQAFAEEDIILVNTSNPLSSDIEWILPDAAQVIQQDDETITLRFAQPGAYEITLLSVVGDCFQAFTKPIIVQEPIELPDVGDAETPFIQEFTLFPNPTSSQLTVTVDLSEEASISLRLFGLLSNTPYEHRELQGEQNYRINFNMDLVPGVYFLLLETPKGSEIRKVIME